MSKLYMVEFKKLFDAALSAGLTTVESRQYAALETARLGIKKH